MINIGSGVRTAFDVICEFGVPDGQETNVEIEIVRVHGGIMAPPGIYNPPSGVWRIEIATLPSVSGSYA